MTKLVITFEIEKSSTIITFCRDYLFISIEKKTEVCMNTILKLVKEWVFYVFNIFKH